MLKVTMLDERCRDVRVDLLSDPFAVRETLVTLRETWKEHKLDKSLCDTAEQVLAEVLNNVVEHAHQERSDGNITLAAKADNEGLFFEVRDNGVPMPKGQLPAGTPANFEAAFDDLPEGGFGWFLIRSLSQDLSYNREGDWNVFRFKIPIAA